MTMRRQSSHGAIYFANLPPSPQAGAMRFNKQKSWATPQLFTLMDIS
jgi:hypothetical protein